MKSILVLLMMILATAKVGAQPVSFESVRIAEAIVEGGWVTLERTIPLVVDTMESQLRSRGASANAAKVLALEVGRSMTRENVTKFFAHALSDILRPEELKEMSDFVRSPIGKRFMQLNQDIATNQKYIFPIIREACASALSKLPGDDQGAVRDACRGI